ncbi:MAG: hypothetical protein AAFO91_11340, partial [Bacteroidota bacterium]
MAHQTHLGGLTFNCIPTSTGFLLCFLQVGERWRAIWRRLPPWSALVRSPGASDRGPGESQGGSVAMYVHRRHVAVAVDRQVPV